MVPAVFIFSIRAPNFSGWWAFCKCVQHRQRVALSYITPQFSWPQGMWCFFCFSSIFSLSLFFSPQVVHAGVCFRIFATICTIAFLATFSSEWSGFSFSATLHVCRASWALVIMVIFINKGFGNIVSIFIVISTTFWPICPPGFFRCLSNLGTYTELWTTSFIESMGVACSNSILSIPILLLTCSQDWTCNFQITITLCVLQDT